MKNHRFHFTAPVIGCILVLSGALQAAQLDTADVVRLKQLGFSDREIEQEVRKAGDPATVAKEDIAELKKAGIGEGLIATLTGGGQQAEPESPSVAVPAAFPDSTAGAMPAPRTPAEKPALPTPPPVQSGAPAAPERPAPGREAAAPAEPPPPAEATPAGPAEPAAEEFEQPRIPEMPAAPSPEKATAGPAVPPPPAGEKPAVPVVSEEDDFVQPQIPEMPAAPLSMPVPAPAPELQPAQPAVTLAQTTSHRMQAGQTAAFNLPYNNTGDQDVMVTAMAPGAEWISITPTGVPAKAGASVDFKVRLSATALGPGNYQGSVFLSAGGASIEYPFHLTVLPAARPLPRPIRPVPAPIPQPITPGEIESAIRVPGYPGYRPAPQPGYGTLPQNLVGSWAAVLPGAWGMQTILYIEIEPAGRYTYTVLEGNQLTDQSTGSLTAEDNLLRIVTDEGDAEAYGYRMFGEQLYINMPEWGGNVPFHRQ